MPVAYDNDLPSPCDRPNGIFRADLAGLVNHDKIEFQSAGFEILSDRKRTH